MRGMCTERRRPIWPNPHYLTVKRFTPRGTTENRRTGMSKRLPFVMSPWTEPQPAGLSETLG